MKLARIAFTFACALALPLGARADDTGHQLARRMFELARPGVVIVQGEQRATVTFPHPRLTTEKKAALQQAATQRFLAGAYPRTRDGLLQAFMDEFFAHPLDYFEPDDAATTADVKVSGLGSGAVISPDGYLVTNAHVAAPDPDEVKTRIVAQAMQKYIESDVKDEIAGLARYSFVPTADELGALVDAEKRFYTRYLTVGTITRSANVFWESSSTHKLTAVPAEITNAVGAPTPGKDVAILKIEGENAPTIPLGDDQALETGDRLYVLGFPAGATYNPQLSSSSYGIPTLTSGVMSARKQMPGGWEIIQTDAAATHGSSGGPVLDEDGRMVGILTFGASDPTSREGAMLAGVAYVVPTSVIREFVGQAGVRPGRSAFDGAYGSAIEAFDDGHYRAALEGFETADRLNPGRAFVAEYITKSESEIAAGHDRSVPWGIVGGAAALTALLAGWFGLRRRRSERLSG